MATFNFQNREIVFKIVYVGPAMSGKTTNLVKLYEQIPQKVKTELVKIDTEDERTLFFDHFAIEVEGSKSFKNRFTYFTVPGQFFYKGTRRVVLQGADGIVFVADSAPGRQDANARAWREMKEHLFEEKLWGGEEIVTSEGKKIVFDPKPQIPLIVQANKRDLPDAVDLEIMRSILDPEGLFPWLEAVATEGKGVKETSREITKAVIEHWQQRRQALQR